MEEMWKEINLASFKEITSSSSASITNSNSFFQQFLFTSQPFRNNILLSSSSSSSSSSASTSAFSLGRPLLPAAAVTPKASSSHSLPNSNSSVSLLMPSLGNKRPFPQSDHAASYDTRSKRMIKNRESAARSRARKQEIHCFFFFFFFFWISIANYRPTLKMDYFQF